MVHDIGHSTTSQQNLEYEGVQVTKNIAGAKRGYGKRKRTSKVWNHFTTEQDKDSRLLIGTCKYCKVAKYKADSHFGTTNLRRHLDSCSEYKKLHPEGSVSGKEIDLKVFYQKLAVVIIRHGYSFSIVEHEALQDAFKYLNDYFEPITRNTVKKICMEMHMDMKGKVGNVLKGLPGRICLTCDMWKACNSRGYMCVTAHYIDHSWKLNSKVLCFQHCPPPHGGYELSVEVADLLSEWGVEDKIFSLTADNASNMERMIYNLKGVLKGLVCKGKYFHIRCCAHILNLIVKDGLGPIDASISKIREAVKYIDGSEARLQKFINLFRNSEISYTCALWMDVPTRWNSTYTMLERALKYRPMLHRYFVEMDGAGSKYLLSYEEWDKIEKICELLKPFYEITNLFSGSDYPTANLYFPEAFTIQCRLRKAIESDDIDINVAAHAMLEKFNKYWRDFVLVLAIAIVFDPRYKLKFVRFALSKTHGKVEGERMCDEIHLYLNEMFKEYQMLAGVESSSRVGSSSAVGSSETSGGVGLARSPGASSGVECSISVESSTSAKQFQYDNIKVCKLLIYLFHIFYLVLNEMQINSIFILLYFYDVGICNL